MDEVLNGNDDRLFARRLSDLITGRDPSGGNVVLTIDPAVQQAAYEALTSRDYAGAVVALRPQTGQILAMASTPIVRPEPAGQPQLRRRRPRPGRSSTTRTRRCCRTARSPETYPPGSTFKLIDTAAALQNGVHPGQPADGRVGDHAAGHRDARWRTSPAPRAAPGPTASLRDALARSCNTAFAELGAQLGEDKIRAQAEAFGVGTEPPAIPMTVAPSTLGDIPDTASLQQSAIGQRDVAVHAAAERDDRRRDRERRPGHGALPRPAGAQPDAGRARRDPAGPARPGDARGRREDADATS